MSLVFVRARAEIVQRMIGTSAVTFTSALSKMSIASGVCRVSSEPEMSGIYAIPAWARTNTKEISSAIQLVLYIGLHSFSALTTILFVKHVQYISINLSKLSFHI